MSGLLQVVAAGSLGLLVYIYFGYPLVVALLSVLIPKKRVVKADIEPSVTLIISCFNEEDVLEAKLANALSLDYPKEKLDILVVSDASDDRTDAIALAHADRGVRLVRQEERKGKTSALNLAVPEARGEMIVFSDANAFYQPDSIRKLMAPLNDPTVGYVVGEARYTDIADASGSNENSYWQYEILIKTFETKLHSMVGGDGAIYAIRKELYEPLLEQDINDFVNPLQIILKGYRGIFEPQAVALEETGGSYDKEFRRKVRIVNRSFSGLMRVKGVMNPFRTGIYALLVISHKLLRWLAPIFMITLLLSSVTLSFMGSLIFTWVSIGAALFYLGFYLGYLAHRRLESVPLLLIPYYFVMVNLAALLGLLQSFRGQVQATWSSPRAATADGREPMGAGGMLAHTLFAASVAYLLFSLRPLLG